MLIPGAKLFNIEVYAINTMLGVYVSSILTTFLIMLEPETETIPSK